jgi:large conductance mechanosensitive channel
MIREFREFILKGNVFELAVAFILGVAFAAVVASFVKDIVSPIIGLITGGLDFSNIFIDLSGGDYATLAAAQEAGAATINIGLFLNAVLNLIIVGVVLFLMVKAYNAAKARMATVPPPAAPLAPTREEVLLAEIRDLLAQGRR